MQRAVKYIRVQSELHELSYICVQKKICTSIYQPTCGAIARHRCAGAEARRPRSPRAPRPP